MNSFDGGNANYYCMNGIEAQDVIEAFELNFSRGSAVKYILRAGRKDSEIRDLEKARASTTGRTEHGQLLRKCPEISQN